MLVIKEQSLRGELRLPMQQGMACAMSAIFAAVSLIAQHPSDASDDLKGLADIGRFLHGSVEDANPFSIWNCANFVATNSGTTSKNAKLKNGPHRNNPFSRDQKPPPEPAFMSAGVVPPPCV